MNTPVRARVPWLLAVQALDAGRVQEGIELLRAAPGAAGASVTADPDLPAHELAPLLGRAGRVLMGVGESQLALQCFERCLAVMPEAAGAHNNRGILLQALGRPQEAIASYDAALRVRPAFPEAHNNRGNALRELGLNSQALASYEAALQLRPDFAQAHNNRGNLLRDLGRAEEALACYSEALSHQPGFGLAASNRGQLLLDLGSPAAALASFESAATAGAEDADTLFGRALALLRLGQAAAALEGFAAARRGGIEESEVLSGEAAAFAELGQHRDAAERLVQLLRLAPHYEYAPGSLLHSRLHCCDWTDVDELSQQLQGLIAAGRRASHPQSLLAVSDSPQLQHTCAQQLVAARYPPRAMARTRAYAPASAGAPAARLRIAYVSADFREHPVARALVGVLEHHDRGRFEVIGASLRPSGAGPFEQRVRNAFDGWLQLDASSDREAAERLAERGVDIAIDLMGFTHGMRLGIFAHRPAPLQVSYLGYAGTSGAPYLDYLLADEVVIPDGHAQWYTEQIVRLPHCCLPTDERRVPLPAPTRAEAGLPSEGLVLCAFTSAYKITPALFDVWMRLLQALPTSVLWLRASGPDAADNLGREAAQRGVEPSRLIFAPYVADSDAHLARQGLADLYLDTLPYNAHSTACDALACGVPLVACAGRSFSARVAASALTAAGLSELITTNLPEYERCALQLLRSPDRLQALKARLAAARSDPGRAPLFDTVSYTRGLEAAYDYMWTLHRQGRSPFGFDVSEARHGR